MKINSVVGFSNAVTGRNIAFERRLEKTEEKDYSDSISKAFDYIGIQNRALIIHGPSFPVADKKRDIGIGSPYYNPDFTNFLKLHGFNAEQLGPNGKLKLGSTSPYESSAFAKNPLFIRHSLLTKPEYASILSNDDIKNLEFPVEQTDKNYTRAIYGRANMCASALMDKAYNNFKEKLQKDNEDALRLQKEFRQFEKDNGYWLDYYAVLDTIAKGYGTDDYSVWNPKQAKLIQQAKEGNQEAIKYYNEYKTDHKYQINKFKFEQFIIDKQSKEDKSIKHIGDLLVGVSPFDELIFKDAFLEGWKIGARDGGIDNSPQLWNIPVVDPNKLFNSDGSLGPAGEFLKLKVQKAVQDSSSLRVDHVFGLVNPYIYKADSVHDIEKELPNGKKVKIPDVKRLESGYISELSLDENHNFDQVLEKIVLPTLNEAGIKTEDVVWEDLGWDATGKYDEIARNKLHIPGLNVLLWSRGENANPECWSYIGSHDSPPISLSIKDGSVMKNNPHAWDKYYLAGYLNPGHNNEDARTKYRNKIEANPLEMFKAKFTELLRSTKNIQISFMDFFGIDKSYNVPGTVSDDNWSLRLPPDWEDKYYKALEGGNKNGSWAINMPEILSQAVKAKTEMEIAKAKDRYNISEDEETEIRSESAELIKSLDKYSEILKEETD